MESPDIVIEVIVDALVSDPFVRDILGTLHRFTASVDRPLIELAIHVAILQQIVEHGRATLLRMNFESIRVTSGRS